MCECNEGFVSSDNGLSNQVSIDGACSQIEPSSFSTQVRAIVVTARFVALMHSIWNNSVTAYSVTEDTAVQAFHGMDPPSVHR